MATTLRLCSGGGGYEWLPDRDLGLDLPTVRRALESRGVPVVDARVMLIAGLGPEVTISRRGRLLFKTPELRDADAALERLREIVPALR